MLLINTMQHDLASSEYLVVCAALNAIAKLITDENNAIPALLPSVEKLLDHANAACEEEGAVLCLQKFAMFSPESTRHLGNAFLEDVVRSRSERDVCEFVRVERFVRERGGIRKLGAEFA